MAKILHGYIGVVGVVTKAGEVLHDMGSVFNAVKTRDVRSVTAR